MQHLDVETARRIARGDSAVDDAMWGKHLATCADCRELVARERSWIRLVNLPDQPTTAPGGAERLIGQLEELAPPRATLTETVLWRIGPLIVTAASLFLLVRVHAPSRGADREESLARQTGASVVVVRRVASQAVALDALRTDPWLAVEYDLLRALADQLAVRDGADTGLRHESADDSAHSAESAAGGTP
ncbi:MAG: hypothetical protein HRU75_05985 [Planctomycetia bacterium]|nr:MAG: hypothetical protein HRU75_05985 [Planctomycetia bacterium]